MRSAFDASSSGSWCSWKGTAPCCRASILDGTTSRITISWPSSAKHAPVTSPTQPAPKMPTLLISRRNLLHGCKGLEALCDGNHRLVRQRVEECIDDPVG